MPNNIDRLTGALLVMALGAAACTDLTALKQENPGQIKESTLFVPRNAQILVNGVIADFECAYARYVVGSGILDDELMNAISASNNFDYDRRTIQTNQAYGTATCGSNQQPPIYTTLSIARADGDTIAARLEGWSDADVPNRTRLIGRSYVYTGYSLVLLGEGMCTAAINLSREMTSAEIFAEAKIRFDKAIAAATTANDTTTLNLALLGRARTQLDLGDATQLAAAGADAARVPAGFLVNTSTDAVYVRRQNFSWVAIGQNAWASVDPTYRHVTLGAGPDPRVAVDSLPFKSTNGTLMFSPSKYSSFVAPMPVAKYAEAQLIVAEAAVRAGDLTAAETAINNARNTHNTVNPAFTMPQYSATGQTAAQVQAQIIEERRRELFMEGHRLGDIRRYGLSLVPAAGTPYPAGGSYGSQSCFPLPDVERINNPNIGH
jgi:starch-binding outer membrane protein, SusD/RagB family